MQERRSVDQAFLPGPRVVWPLLALILVPTGVNARASLPIGSRLPRKMAVLAGPRRPGHSRTSTPITFWWILTDSRVWAATNNGIAESDNYGVTWTRTPFPKISVPPVEANLRGSSNALAAAWNGQTGALEYVTYLGGSAYDQANALAVGVTGLCYRGDVFPGFPSEVRASMCLWWDGDAFLYQIAPRGSGPAVAVTGVTNAASYARMVAPGEIISIFGSALSVTPAATAPSLPTAKRLEEEYRTRRQLQDKTMLAH